MPRILRPLILFVQAQARGSAAFCRAPAFSRWLFALCCPRAGGAEFDGVEFDGVAFDGVEFDGVEFDGGEFDGGELDANLVGFPLVVLCVLVFPACSHALRREKSRTPVTFFFRKHD